jgi:hypothetical protein
MVMVVAAAINDDCDSTAATTSIERQSQNEGLVVVEVLELLLLLLS